jgi:cell division protein FtsB
MRDIGIRIQRYKLSRYRPADLLSERSRLLLTLGLAGWLIWALFVSDHSVVRLMALNAKKAKAEAELAATQAQVAKLEGDLKSANDPDVGERVLRDRHNFAKDGEVLYVMPGGAGTGGPAVVAPPVPAPAPVDAKAAKAAKGAKATTSAPAAAHATRTKKAARH